MSKRLSKSHTWSGTKNHRRLATKLDLAPAGKASPNKKSTQQLPLHENVRGSGYYH
ncbi:hypothetical protein [Polynucleobacter sp. JS-Safj-400b-B2]|uniref:hypothetical protein n=1 Tax=Polynucleobacter sp. JS-Safj-400b-B2 TaxID=2576921 RepID=UPI001C0D7D2F|nr:hypothetical protein [Polynucleobacter sp. JS-Safj-400b-B2]